MIVSTTIDLSPDIYRFFMDVTKDLPDTTPEDFMAIALTLYAARQHMHITLTKKERDLLEQLRREGKLRSLQ